MSQLTWLSFVHFVKAFLRLCTWLCETWFVKKTKFVFALLHIAELLKAFIIETWVATCLVSIS